MSTRHHIKVAQAARAYIQRNIKNHRSSHSPAGHKDAAGRWYPIDEEKQECCAGVRDPSIAWPDSLKKHCCSAKHVARLFDVGELELRRAAREIEAAAQWEAA